MDKIQQHKLDNGLWQMQAMFHKSWTDKIKKQTGATHVAHIKNQTKDGEKVNCIHIKKGLKEIMYGGKTDFSQFTPQDYKEAIKEYNKL